VELAAGNGLADSCRFFSLLESHGRLSSRTRAPSCRSGAGLARPMLATPCHRLPADQDRYGWEFKWDGGRGGHQVRLLSRNGTA